MDLANRFLKAWQEGLVCLHPTDTIPGLSFNPTLNHASERFCEIKGRSAEKTTICLVASADLAINYWSPLPPVWRKALTKSWPTGLSLIWKASHLVPKSLVRSDGSVALRVPRFTDEQHWMLDVLRGVQSPFPTSSVNKSGEPAAINWTEAVNVLSAYIDGFIPDIAELDPPTEPVKKASTLVRICSVDEPTDYQIIRSGVLDERSLNLWLRQ